MASVEVFPFSSIEPVSHSSAIQIEGGIERGTERVAEVGEVDEDSSDLFIASELHLFETLFPKNNLYFLVRLANNHRVIYRIRSPPV